MDVLNSWHLIETLTPGVMTVVSSGGRTRNWTKVDRLSPGPDIDVPTLVAQACQSRQVQEHQVASRRGTFLIRVVPVLGPSGEAHGAQLWLGESGIVPDPPRIVSGISWLLQRTVIAQSLEAALMSGVNPADHVPERTPAEYYAKAVKFDDSESLFAAALNPEHGKSWEGPMSVLHADGHIMRWHCWGKGRTDPGNVGLRLLWHDVTDTTAPDKPTLLELGLPSALESAGTRMAVFDAHTGILTMWLTDAPEWVRWRDVASGRDVVHEEDRSVLTDTLDQWSRSTPRPVVAVIRIRAKDGADWRWQRTEVELRPYPEQLSERLVLAVLPASAPTSHDGPARIPVRRQS